MNLVNKLSPFAAYQFRIAAYNEIGMGEYSEPSPSYNTRSVSLWLCLVIVNINI